MKKLCALSLLCLPLLAAAPAPLAPAPSAGIAVADDVAEWIAEGRRLLEEDQLDEAAALFDRAAQKEGTWRSQVWVIRCWISQGRVNDALNATDQLRGEGADESDLDYLYGMAFSAGAQKKIRDGVSDSALGMNLASAHESLGRACAADGERYRDAFLPLSFAAWMQGALEDSRAAAEQAVALFPQKADAWLQLGRTAMGQFAAANAEESRLEEAAGHLEVGVEAFRKALETFGEPAEWQRRKLKAESARQLGNALIWKQDFEAAAAAFTQAMGWDPSVLDFSALWGYFDALTFRDTLMRGDEAFVARYGADQPGDALLLWWLGYAQFVLGKDAEDPEAGQGFFAEGERSYADCVRKWPAYADSWYYLYRCRTGLGNGAGALVALREFRAVDPAGLIQSLAGERELNIQILDWLASNRYQDAIEDSAFAYELICELAPAEGRYWSTLGQFRRDRGDFMLRRARDAEREAVLAECMLLWESAMDAYEKALEIDPEHPGFLNDAAVVLHYNLNRDLERALEMYEQAAINAKALLDAGGLEEEEHRVIAIALRDSTNNRELLQRKLRGQEAEEDEQEGADEDS